MGLTESEADTATGVAILNLIGRPAIQRLAHQQIEEHKSAWKQTKKPPVDPWEEEGKGRNGSQVPLKWGR